MRLHHTEEPRSQQMKHPSFNVEIRGARTNVMWCDMTCITTGVPWESTPHGHTGEEKKRLTFLIQMQDRREVKAMKTYKLNELSTKLLDGRLVTYTT